MPFEVPESWEWVRICDISFLKAGSFIKAKDIKGEKSNELYPCYGGNGLRGYVETFNYEGIYSLIGRQGALCGNINLVEGKFYATEHAVTTTLLGNIDPYWMFFTLEALNLNQYATGAAQPGLSVERINNVYCPLPPLNEQKRISSKIKSLFVLIERIDNDQLSLKQLINYTKSKVLKLAIRGKLVPQNPNDEPTSVLLKRIRKGKNDKKTTSDKSHYPFKIPKNWMWCGLHEIADVSLGKTLDKQRNTGVFKPYLRSVNVKWGYIDFDDVKEMRFEESEEDRYCLQFGDLLICEGGEAGRAAIWKYKDKSMRYQNALHRVRFKFGIKADFYMYVFWHYQNAKILDSYTKGVTIKHLTGQALKQMLFPLPPVKEQQRIVETIEEIFKVLDIIQENLKENI